MTDRREFLKRAALGGGLAAWSGRRSALAREAAAAKKTTTEPRMKLAVETSMFHRHQPPAVFRMIRESGLRFVELGGAHFNAASIAPPEVAELRRQLDDAGLTPVGAFIVHPVAADDDNGRKAAVQRWRRSIDAVTRLGIKLITTELTGSQAEPDRGEAAWRKSMDEILPWLEQADVHLSVEPHPGDFFEAAAPTVKLLRSYASKPLGYLHCTPHTFFLGESSRRVIAQAGKLLTHVHVADTFRTERIMARAGVGLHLHLRPGLGEVDFDEIVTALTAGGYDGYLSVQLLSHADDPLPAARQAGQRLRRMLTTSAK